VISAAVFDKILSREPPSEKVFKVEISCVFRDINPQAPVHILLIRIKKMD